MNLNKYPPENGSMTINGAKMEWTFRRTKTESAFGIRGSRIFELILKKDGAIVGDYNMGWSTGKKIADEDDESVICLNYLIDRYGRRKAEKKKEE